jgi:hypothetical protein
VAVEQRVVEQQVSRFAQNLAGRRAMLGQGRVPERGLNLRDALAGRDGELRRAPECLQMLRDLVHELVAERAEFVRLELDWCAPLHLRDSTLAPHGYGNPGPPR